MLSFKSSYKPLPPADENQIKRVTFLKQPQFYEHKKLIDSTVTEDTKKPQIPYWLHTLNVYISKEGPNVGPLRESIEDLRSQQLQNHRLSKIILGYDIKAINFENRISQIAFEEYQRQLKGEGSPVITSTKDQNMNQTLSKLQKQQSSCTSPKEKGIKIAPIPDLTSSAPKKPSNTTSHPYKTAILQKINVVNKEDDDYYDLDISFTTPQADKEGDVFYDAIPESFSVPSTQLQTLKGKSPERETQQASRSPVSKLPQIPSTLQESPMPKRFEDIAEQSEESLSVAPPPLGHAVPSTETPFDRLSSNSFKQKRRVSQEANRKYLRSLQIPKRSSRRTSSTSSSNETAKSTVDVTHNQPPSVPEAERAEAEMDTESSLANISGSTLVREYTTPSLELDSRVIYSPTGRVQVVNYSNKPQEGSSKDIAEEPVAVKLHKSDRDSKDSEDVVFFNLQKSRPNSSVSGTGSGSTAGSSIFHRRSSSLSSSFKALRHGGLKRKASIPVPDSTRLKSHATKK